MKIVLIGTGNVATVLGRLIIKAGHEVVQVYGRNKASAQDVTNEVSAMAVNSFNEITTEADFYIIAVSDKAVAEVAGAMPKVKGIVVHTAGSLSKSLLQQAFAKFGVLYPLQSLRKEISDIPVVPLLVDASAEDVQNQLISFAKTLSPLVDIASDEQRLKLHVAAVLCSNFTNHLYALTEQFCIKEKIAFSNLLPLITETANRLTTGSPKNLQTGPAIRGDKITMQKHLKILQAHPQIKKIYELFSESIRQEK